MLFSSYKLGQIGGEMQIIDFLKFFLSDGFLLLFILI